MGISPEAIQSLLCDQAASSEPYAKPVRAGTETKKADTFGPMDVDFFRDMVENAAIGVFVTSSTGRALLFNRQMASILGADSPQDAISFYRDLFTHLYVDPERREELLQRLREKGVVQDFTYKALKKDGSLCWIRMNAGVLKKFSDESFLINGFAEDITRRIPGRETVLPECPDCSCSYTLNEIKKALQDLLGNEEEDRNVVGERIFTNYERIILPYIEKLKKIAKSDYQQQVITILEMNLKNIISPFAKNLSGPLGNLSPAEIQVADLIRHGKSTKEVAEIMNTGIRTVSFHRENIRKKLDLKNKKVNLRTFLLSLK